jgi:hypothetical protein
MAQLFIRFAASQHKEDETWFIEHDVRLFRQKLKKVKAEKLMIINKMNITEQSILDMVCIIIIIIRNENMFIHCTKKNATKKKRK